MVVQGESVHESRRPTVDGLLKEGNGNRYREGSAGQVNSNKKRGHGEGGVGTGEYVGWGGHPKDRSARVLGGGGGGELHS